MTNYQAQITQAAAELAQVTADHGPAREALAATEARVQEVKDAISSGDARLGLTDLTEADTTHRGAVLVEQGLSKRIADLEQEIALKRGQQLAAEIVSGEAGVMTDGGDAAWAKFYYTVRVAISELIDAANKHDAAHSAIVHERLGQTDYQHTVSTQSRTGDGFHTIKAPAGKPWSWIKYEEDRYGNPVIKARREGHPIEWAEVGKLNIITEASIERNVWHALFHARNGMPLESAPTWAK